SVVVAYLRAAAQPVGGTSARLSRTPSLSVETTRPRTTAPSTEGTFLERPFYFALGRSARKLFSLIPLLFSTGQAKLDLSEAPLVEIEPQGDERVALLLNLTGETTYYRTVHECFACTRRLVVPTVAILVRAD